MAESKSAALPLGDAPIPAAEPLALGAADHSLRATPATLPACCRSELAQRHLLDPVRDALGQNEARAGPCRQNVLVQVS
jgi:hypothetical protein